MGPCCGRRMCSHAGWPVCVSWNGWAFGSFHGVALVMRWASRYFLLVLHAEGLSSLCPARNRVARNYPRGQPRLEPGFSRNFEWLFFRGNVIAIDSKLFAQLYRSIEEYVQIFSLQNTKEIVEILIVHRSIAVSECPLGGHPTGGNFCVKPKLFSIFGHLWPRVNLKDWGFSKIRYFLRLWWKNIDFRWRMTVFVRANTNCQNHCLFCGTWRLHRMAGY